MLHNHVTGRRMIREIVTVVRREYSLSPTIGHEVREESCECVSCCQGSGRYQQSLSLGTISMLMTMETETVLKLKLWEKELRSQSTKQPSSQFPSRACGSSKTS